MTTLDEIKARDARWDLIGDRPRIVSEAGVHDSWGKAVSDRNWLLAELAHKEAYYAQFDLTPKQQSAGSEKCCCFEKRGDTFNCPLHGMKPDSASHE